MSIWLVVGGNMKSVLTMRKTMMTSQAPLIMYNFQPMLTRAMGIVKTKRSLRTSQCQERGTLFHGKSRTHATPFATNWNTPIPFDRIA